MKTTEEGYLLLFSALDKITDPSKRAAFVKAAGIGQESLRFLADGSLDLKATIEEVKKLQGYLGPKAYEDAAAYGDAMDNLGLSWRGLRDKLTAAALPAIVPMLEDLNKFFANNSEAIASGFREIAVEVSNGVRSMASWFGSLKSDDWKGFWNDLKGIASAISNVASTVNQVVQAMGGWKVLIGSLIALKVANWIKGLAGNLTDLLPGMGGTPGPADKKGAPWWAPGVQAWMYDQGKTWMMNRLDALPRPNGPGAVADPGSFDPWEDLKKIIGTWTRDTVQNKTADLISERTGQIAEAQSQLSDANSIIADMQRSGNDKKYPGAFERALQMRDSIQARIADLRAGLELLKRDGADVGRKMGEEAGKSFIDSIRSFFQKSSYSEGGVSNGGIVNASLRIGGGRAAGRAQAMAGRGHGVAPNFGSAKSMLDLIGTAEGTDKGRGYNETLAYGAYTGGDRNLVGMTLDEIDALQTQMLRHPGNRFNSSALGRYQFTRTRLRDLRKRYGIPGSARYDQNLQDQLAKLSLSERGGTLGAIRNEWEGLRNVPDDILRDAMRRDRQRKEKRQRDKVEGAASVDVRFHGTPAGTKVGAKATGLFREVRLDTGRSMKPATA
ncbi:hypothetical protein OSH11_17125 [Kaistia dalseonensis]|uniref:Muramidase (Phage lysozyme) n=1 Tax=Kaistia dalseonensis TaxID=410840 RepID=A0ABU0H9S5_9HYPH|nr:hypothetical protein [Kaistia dalseonensis]MCX5496432.1 hypothetical protein [Kaistia dalseonensis]MDQ0439052.1 muramidase (phage lysozyme) [Kaistia dalseonensis]